jgi:hypothetical protein
VNDDELEGNIRGLILRYYPSNFLKGLRKTTKTLIRIASLWANI